jgi:hypothetical protein
MNDNQTVLSKLKVEIKDLEAKIEKLKSFTSNPVNRLSVGHKQSSLMDLQVKAMCDYRLILSDRILDLRGKNG